MQIRAIHRPYLFHTEETGLLPSPFLFLLCSYKEDVPVNLKMTFVLVVVEVVLSDLDLFILRRRCLLHSGRCWLFSFLGKLCLLVIEGLELVPQSSDITGSPGPVALQRGQLKVLKEVSKTVLKEDDPLQQHPYIQLLLDLSQELIHVTALRPPLRRLFQCISACTVEEEAQELQEVGLVDLSLLLGFFLCISCFIFFAVCFGRTEDLRGDGDLE